MKENSKSTETRNKILDAAANVFARRGIHKARMDDIVEEAGVSKGGLYWHFKSKDDIIVQIVSRFLEMDMGKIRKMLKTDMSSEEKLYKVVEITYTDLMKIKPLLPLMFEFISKAYREPIIRELIRKYYSIGLNIFGELVQEGIDSGEFIETDPDLAAKALVGLYEGLILVDAVYAEMDNWLENARNATGLILNGLKQQN